MDHASLRKAAILVRSLDADAAASLVAQLSSDEARALRDAIRELGPIEDDERESLLSDLRHSDRTQKSTDSSVELSLSFTGRDPEPSRVTSPLTSSVRHESPFDWLEEGDLPSLAERLAREQVATVALVLSLLPAKRAGGVLSTLPSQLQCDALERLADLGDVDPASLQLVEADLETWLLEQKATKRRRLDRQSSIASILEHTSPTTREHVTVSLSRQGAEWLAPLRSRINEVAPTRKPEPVKRTTIASSPQRNGLRRAAPPIPSKIEPTFEPTLPPFTSLATIDARAFAEVLRQCGSAVVVRALAGADDAMHRQIKRWLPASHLRELMRRVHSLSDVSLREIDQAQRQMVKVAARLAGESLIDWPAMNHVTHTTTQHQ